MLPFRIIIAVALSFAPVPAGAQMPADRPARSQNSNRSVAHPYAVHVADAARRFGIPEAWIWHVMRVESGGNPRAVSRAGAMGLMQLMPATWAAMRARFELGTDPFDVRDNILAGAAYLRAMHDRYGNPSAMLAAYNAGPGRYDDYLRGRPLPAETLTYLARLAPAIDGVAAQVAAAAPTDPFVWRQSGIFVRIADTVQAANAAQPQRIDSADETAAPMPSSPLFVRRANTTGSQ